MDTSLLATPITPDLVHGAVELEPTDHGLLVHRLPAWARAQVPDDQLRRAESQPAGVRLVVRTAATVIELDTLRTKMGYVGAPPRPDGVYDLVVDGVLTGQGATSGGRTLQLDLSTGATETIEGPVGTVRYDGLPGAETGAEKTVEIWLPHTETTELVGLRSDAPVTAVAPTGKRWVHHGSSISHGSNAGSPTGTWPAVAARAARVDLVNLGFGGSALLDPFTARTIRDLPADVISVKIGINLLNLDLMRLRAFGPAVHGFLDTIREGHPDTPLLVVSAIACPIHEDTPGPAAMDMSRAGEGILQFAAQGDPAEVAAGKLTLRVVRAELARIVAERSVADPALHYLDGLELYGEADLADHPLPDQLHPDTATHQLIGERFAALAFGAGGLLA